MVVIQMNSDPI